MREHEINWVAPAPLWGLEQEIRQPLLVEVAGDDFIDRLRAALEAGPDALLALKPGPGEDGALKLHQPIHGRYGLVLASLCCVLPGLPEYAVDTRTSQLGFVLRRLLNGVESGWIPDPSSNTVRGRWAPVDPEREERVLLEGEDLVSMFPLPWRDGERQRRLWAGVLPLGGRELWNDSKAPLPSDGKPPSAWQHGLQVKVLNVVERLVKARSAQRARDPEEQEDTEELTPKLNERLLVSAWCLHDLLALLLESFPSLHARIVDGRGTDPDHTLGSQLSTHLIPTEDGKRLSWWEALRIVHQARASLQGPSPSDAVLRFDLGALGDKDQGWLTSLLWIAPDAGLQGFPEETARARINAETRYLVRCVYRRPGCQIQPTRAMSDPTAPFSVAALFDPDAPARPIRIPLPTDISIAALRRFKPNVSFPFSAALNDKISRLSSPDTFKGELGGSAGIGFGMICSLSIPVITLCASISLMIFISLFDIAFSWLAFIRICLPYPKSKED